VGQETHHGYMGMARGQLVMGLLAEQRGRNHGPFCGQRTMSESFYHGNYAVDETDLNGFDSWTSRLLSRSDFDFNKLDLGCGC
jgi:hypothetical protein